MLEPIEEGDLDLKTKFLKGGVSPEKMAAPSLPKAEAEKAPAPEAPERKEGRMEKEDAYAKILSKAPVQNQNMPVADVATDATSANAEIDVESKIGNLIKLAETKGIPHAVKVARHMEDNYALDEFHDRMLGEELHKALVAKGMIREV
ncbi:MAG: hypothetical protein NTY33_00965 [Candidatus Moranbacteria bacterium]|nr:hypothetical protein [Candidatus Moranbacteria bacterium]